MKNYMKRVITLVLALATILSACIFSAGTVSASSDPSDSYVVQTAPNEDSDISLWFEHSFKKVHTDDKTHSGMNTYSVYMAKNEVENAQFVLYSDVDKNNLTATITSFTNEAGDTISSQLYYEMYVNVTNINTDSVLGIGPDGVTDVVREGETPDPVVPLSAMGSLVKRGIFSLVGGKSQALFIKLRTTEDTPAGWYSAQLDIKDANKNIIKTVTVYAYVWDFVISEKTALETSFYMNNDTSYGGSYKAFYDYMLDNRLCAMDIPKEGSKDYLTLTNSYLLNDRVTSIRVSNSGCGATKSGYLEGQIGEISKYSAIYDRFHSSDIWDEVKDKFYFYTADEPLPVPDESGRSNINDVNSTFVALEKVWENPRVVIPHGEEHGVPQEKYTKPLTQYATKDLYDITQSMMDNGSCTLWCPRIYAFTPKSEIDAYGKYAGVENPAGWSDQIRTLSGPYSGAYGYGNNQYYNWEAHTGYYADRINSYVANEAAKGNTHESWAYSAGYNKSYSYTNHLIENSGIQTKLMFWQLYQEDVTGYLYYGVNNWNEYDANNGGYVDTTPTGTKTNAAWKTNKLPYANGMEIHGNGILFYGASQGKVMGVDLVGSLRVEIMRDGVEEYQMFTMLDELKGEGAAKAIVGKVSKNVVNYLSMPKFTPVGFASDMDDYDILEATRRELGNAVEAATLEGACDHTWNNGTVVKAAQCIVAGEKLYTCTKCGAEKTEWIPMLHTVGDCFEAVSGTAATCTSDGTEVMRCTICSYEKTVTTPAFHSDKEHYTYSSKSDSVHDVFCDVCDEKIDSASHTLFTGYTNTCTEDGYKTSYCRYCDYSVNVEEAAAKGHNMVDGDCTRCDYSENQKEYTVTVDGVATVYEAGATVGLSKEFYVENLQGKRFSNWSGDTDVLDDVTLGVTSFTMPEKDVVLNSNYITVGDANGDGSINAADLAQLKFITSGKLSYTNSLDIDNDGSITAVDMNLIKRMLLSAYVPKV